MTKAYRNLTILAGLIFIIQAFRWMLNLKTFLIVCAVNFVLLAVFFSSYLLSKKVKRKSKKILIRVVSILVLLCWGIFTLGNEFIGRQISITTNPHLYGSTMKSLHSWNAELVSHFPNKIPKNATRIKFSFAPGFLQGGMHDQLRYAADSKQIEQQYERFYQKMQKLFHGGNTNIHMNEEEGMPTTFFYTKDNNFEGHSFPDDFVIMTFDPVLKKEDREDGFYWNHGESHGVAISKTRNEIIYWAESW